MATKVGRYKPEVDEMFDFSAERTLRSVDESLQRLGLDYVDIIQVMRKKPKQFDKMSHIHVLTRLHYRFSINSQVHDMEFAPNLDIIINETLPALQKIKQSGKARFIGITGYPLENFKYEFLYVSNDINVCIGRYRDL